MGYHTYFLDLRDVDKIIVRLEQNIVDGRLDEIDILKITVRPEDVREDYKGYSIDVSLDKIVLTGSKDKPARLLAYLLKNIKNSDKELYHKLLNAMIPSATT